MRFFIVVLLLLSGKVCAQVNSGARYMAMANAGTALEDVYSLGNNQAGIASIEFPELAFAFQEHFYPTNTQSVAAMVVIPSKIGAIGLYSNRYAMKHSFAETKSAITYARLLKSKLAVAVTMNYHRLAIPDYATTETMSFDLGFQYHLSEEWLWGVQYSSFDVPVKLKLGTSYLFSKQVLLALDSEYSFEKSADFRLGLEYSIQSWLKLRGGTSVNPFMHYAGTGLSFRKFNMDAASSFHPQLGISPQLSLGYAF